MRTSLVAIATATVLAGCATTPPPSIQTGPNAEVTVDGLHRVDNSRMQMAWIKPDVDLRGYTAVMLDPVYVAYQKDPQGRRRAEQVGTGEPNFALSATQMENLKSWFHEAIVEVFSDRGACRVTDTPGPDVLRISADLLDLVVRVPTERTGGRSRTLTIVRRRHTGGGRSRLGER